MSKPISRRRVAHAIRVRRKTPDRRRAAESRTESPPQRWARSESGQGDGRPAVEALRRQSLQLLRQAGEGRQRRRERRRPLVAEVKTEPCRERTARSPAASEPRKTPTSASTAASDSLTRSRSRIATPAGPGTTNEAANSRSPPTRPPPPVPKTTVTAVNDHHTTRSPVRPTNSRSPRNIRPEHPPGPRTSLAHRERPDPHHRPQHSLTLGQRHSRSLHRQQFRTPRARNPSDLLTPRQKEIGCLDNLATTRPVSMASRWAYG